MPETITCPKCGRPLRLPDGLLGGLVQCPACQNVFTATAPVPPPRPAQAPAVEVGWRPTAGGRQQDDSGPSLPQVGENEDRRQPHRGVLILSLGILGLLLSCLPPVGWVFGGVAMSLANADLQEMKDGRMDRSGVSLTESGKVCGVLAVIMASVFLLLGCLVAIAQLE
jgi:hypothetical protein